MAEEQKKVVNLTYPILVILLLVAAFLGGSFLTRMKYEKSGDKNASQSAQPAAKVSPVAQPTQAPYVAKKSEKPIVKFFVMAFCPYGNQAESGLKPVYELLTDKVDFEPVYIVADAKNSCEQNCAGSVFNEARCQQYIDAGQVADMATCQKYFPYKDADTCLKEKCTGLKAGEYTSLHGSQELNQDVRELCAWQQDTGKKWWNFVDKVNTSCTSSNADTCWTAQAQAAGLDTAKIKTCQTGQATTLLKGQTEITGQYNVSGSPTIYINDVLYNGGRSPEDYKKAICDSFDSAPSECQTALGTASAGTAAGGCN